MADLARQRVKTIVKRYSSNMREHRDPRKVRRKGGGAALPPADRELMLVEVMYI